MVWQFGDLQVFQWCAPYYALPIQYALSQTSWTKNGKSKSLIGDARLSIPDTANPLTVEVLLIWILVAWGVQLLWDSNSY